ncbi:hypothetical protein Tco_1439276 [Tanacetum coccineum]
MAPKQMTQAAIAKLVSDEVAKALAADRAPMTWRCRSTWQRCGPTQFHGKEGAIELCRWFEKMECTFGISECAERNKVKFAAATLQGRAYTPVNLKLPLSSLSEQTGKHRYDMKKMMLEEFCPKKKYQGKMKLYRMAHGLMEQKVSRMEGKNADQEQRKWEGEIKGIIKAIAVTTRETTVTTTVIIKTITEGMEKKLDGRNAGGHVYAVKDVDQAQGPNVLIMRPVIICGKKEVHIPLKNRMLVVKGDSNSSRLKVISCIKARKYIERGCHLFLAHITEKEKSEKRLEDVPVICDFPEVFPDDLPGLPPSRQVEFKIDLVPGAAPVARAPYRLAPSEMKELSEQLKELLEKGFIARALTWELGVVRKE